MPRECFGISSFSSKKYRQQTEVQKAVKREVSCINKTKMIPVRLTVCLFVTALLVSELMPTTDANLATIQASWKAMKRRMRQKRRMVMPNLVSVRKMRKRVISGDRRLSCVRFDYLGRCTRYRVMFLWG